jgi:hypothetical protein
MNWDSMIDARDNSEHDEHFPKTAKNTAKNGVLPYKPCSYWGFPMTGNPYAITERPLVAKQLQRGALQLGLGDPNLKPASVYTYLMKVYGLHCEMVDTVLSFD